MDYRDLQATGKNLMKPAKSTKTYGEKKSVSGKMVIMHCVSDN